jgi:hypothetical protein
MGVKIIVKKPCAPPKQSYSPNIILGASDASCKKSPVNKKISEFRLNIITELIEVNSCSGGLVQKEQGLRTSGRT